MHYVESIGPILGIVAFVGLAVLAFLLFQQARDLRRLREWAGRAPERAQEAADAGQAAADASRGEEGEGEAPAQPVPPGEAEGVRGRIAAAWARVSDAVGPRLSEVDRRLPVDGRYLLAVAAVAIIAAGVLTGGFGLGGGGGGGEPHKHAKRPTVAILNGTAVPNLAARVDQDVVKPAGYKAGSVDNAGSSFSNTVVMFASGSKDDASSLAKAVKPKLGPTPTQEMTPDVKSRAGGAALALALGLDDARFGS